MISARQLSPADLSVEEERMENIIKSYCDHLVAFDKAKDVENWVKKSMEAALGDVRNELKKKYPFLNEYSDDEYLYLAFYCEKNGLDFLIAATEVLNSKDHDVYSYIDGLNYQKYNDENAARKRCRL